ncbi:MAG: hypothetical protein JSS16_12185 [Proteobacteria bacterium]|nr:hypothetical protein [Pseudomonadota bacterium]
MNQQSTSTLPAAGEVALHAEAANAAAMRLRDWLLRGSAQLREGDQAGGVAGTIGADGKPLYVYAEITGYYLSWLADISGGEDDAQVRERARLALGWAARHFSAAGQMPQTRVHLTAGEPDWRNDAAFFFDLAMLLRGVDAIAEAGIVTHTDAVRGTLHEQLSQFVRDDTLLPAIQLRGTQPLPPRWSTRGGPFLVKASSRVALSGNHAQLPQGLALACARESGRWAMQAADIELGMLHPTLYFAEGLLLSRPDRADAVAQLLHRCLAAARADGALPETAGETDGKVRNDILAQALRVGLLLRQLGAAQAPGESELDRLAAILLARVETRDSLPFNADAAAQANVWGTMFAEQALRWYANRPGTARPSAAALV